MTIAPESTVMTTTVSTPTLEEIRAARALLGDRVRLTPVWPWRSDVIEGILGADTELLLKLELFQFGGSFKPRGALMVMLSLPPDALVRGVTALSGGNHAIAVAYAAKVVGTSAKVVIPRTASPVRIERCRALGAEVVLVADVHEAFATVKEIETTEGRTFVHPFEGPLTALGTATVGLELGDQAAALGTSLDAVVVAVGGGGLCAGIAAAVKQMRPECVVYAVEPEGADTLFRSFQSGQPESIDRVRTIADSLGAPHAAPYSLALCQRFVDEVVLVDDDAICRAMALLFSEMKLACEPAGAAALAAVCGPLRERLTGRRVGVVVCGSNIDVSTFAAQVARGEASALERGW
jgi:threonine dehydratase